MPTKKTASIDIVESRMEQVTYRLLGQSPLLIHRLAVKAQRELLLPSDRKARMQERTWKHDPLNEYRESVHRFRKGTEPTLLCFPATAFKNAMRTAALDTAGTTKAATGRSLYIPGEYVPIWGIPQMHMAPVRSADIARTPDIRTRAICPEWATEITVRYFYPQATVQLVSNLLASAGMRSGIGEFRMEKGSGSFGQFMIVSPDSPEMEQWEQIVAEQGKEVQEAALEEPDYYDTDTEELYRWFTEEIERRTQKGQK